MSSRNTFHIVMISEVIQPYMTKAYGITGKFLKVPCLQNKISRYKSVQYRNELLYWNTQISDTRFNVPCSSNLTITKKRTIHYKCISIDRHFLFEITSTAVTVNLSLVYILFTIFIFVSFESISLEHVKCKIKLTLNMCSFGLLLTFKTVIKSVKKT